MQDRIGDSLQPPRNNSLHSATSTKNDSNGNVTQASVWTYLYDYLNRITLIGGGGSTSTYGYGSFRTCVFQAGTTSTTILPQQQPLRHLPAHPGFNKVAPART